MISDSDAWKLLKEHAETIRENTHLRDLLQDENRCRLFRAEFNGIIMDFTRQNATTSTMELLFSLANTAQLRKKIESIAEGRHVNSTEDRAVLHMALRYPPEKSLFVDGQNITGDVQDVLQAIRKFTSAVRSGDIRGSTGKVLKNVISIGIGGSYLGPEFVYEALRHETKASVNASGRVLRFLANVDPVDVIRATENLDPEETLIIVISKTFTTAETMLNARTLRQWIVKKMESKGVSAADAISKHMVAVSDAISKVEEFGINEKNIFKIWNWVGGRYSVTSAVGLLPLSLQYGYDVMELFLKGAHDMDTHFVTAPLHTNLPVILGLIGLWNSTFLGHSSRALLPYSQALIRFAAHIQQVDMESNGKRVSVDGIELPFSTGEVNFGEPGTNGQHSFYQLIHQGQIVPAEFIGFIQSQNPLSLPNERVSNHDELMSNFFAQPDALAYGKSFEDLDREHVPKDLQSHKYFPGNRPSIMILFEKLDAYSCGQLLALYEHRTAVQGAIWGINSFDQWGVELGKVLASKVRQQLEDSRKNHASIAGFNPSTSYLLEKYLCG